MVTASLVFIYFYVYSLLGWIAEFFYMLVKYRKIKRPDFLWMPIAAPYGFGALAIVLFVMPYVDNPFLVFLLSVVLTTAIEFVSHIIMEKAFHIELWNYESKNFNFQGRIALTNSLYFGVLGLALVYVIHPLVVAGVELLSPTVIVTVAVILFVGLLVDTVNASSTMIRLRFSKIGGSLGEILNQTQIQINKLLPFTADTNGKKPSRLSSFALKIHRANLRRLHRAYPRGTSRGKKKK